jgi:hypothetical protein
MGYIPTKKELLDIFTNEWVGVQIGRPPLEELDAARVMGTMSIHGASVEWGSFVHNFLKKGHSLFECFSHIVETMASPFAASVSEQDVRVLKMLLYSYLNADFNPQAFVKDFTQTDYNECREWEKLPLP